MSTAAEVAGPLDGRRLRSERTRRTVLDTVLALIEAGGLPTVVEVAAAAGISERSLFRHFDTRDELFVAAVDHALERMRPMVVDVEPTGALEGRTERFVTARAELFEATAPLRRAAPHYALRSAPMEVRLAEVRRLFRSQVERTFAPELARAAPHDAGELADALDAALSGEAWDHLRLVTGASAARARRVQGRTVLALLASTPSPDAPRAAS